MSASSSLAGRALRGRLAELLAALWLQAHGCAVLGRRRVVAGVEVDLLARTRHLALVVEVKSRRRSSILSEDLVPLSQQRRLLRAAQVFGRRLDLPVRVDLVEIRWGSWPLVRWHRGPWDP